MKIYLIAGEVSGDKHGAILIKALKSAHDHIEFRFTGGDEMEKATGQKSLIPVGEMAFMGFFQLMTRVFSIFKWLKKVEDDIQAFNPDLVVLIDYPGFNLRIAKWAKIRGLKVAYYISPKVWAWNASRITTIKQCVDRMYCILPFEKDFYANHGYEVEYYGNPLMDEILHFEKQPDFLLSHQISRPVIALVPGSRAQEIKKMLPVMAKTMRSFPDYQILIPRSPNIDAALVWDHIPEDIHSRCLVLDNAYFDILAHARFALVTSGTATLEAALFDVPQVVCYKTGSLTYWLAKRLVNIRFISLVNIIAGKELVKECIQHECSEETLKWELQKLIDLTNEQRSALYRDLFEKMGTPGSAARVAGSIIQWINPT